LLLFVVVLLLVVVAVLGLRFGFENNDVLTEGVDTSNDDVDGGECGTTGVANIAAPDDDDDDDDGEDVRSSLALYCECNANTVLLSISFPIT